MAYGRVYIENLRKKVISLFAVLREENRLGEDNFIAEFKRKYPKDYALLQYEWEFKVHEFKKNRKGNPKPHPIRPDKILSNMYKNYYFKLVKYPSIKKSRTKALNDLRSNAGQYGFLIKDNEKGKYDVINKKTKEIVCGDLTYPELSRLVHSQEIKRIGQGA